MPGITALPLFAVHIPDNLLSEWWVAGGFVLAGGLALFGAWRIRDEEIPQVGVLTATFFVASLIHVPLGVSSVHLLFNGLLGVVLGRRAALAIPVGVSLQAILFQHGGYTTIGINSCVMTLPALLSWQLFALLQRVPWVRKPWFRMVLVTLSTVAWILSSIYGVALLVSNDWTEKADPNMALANRLTLHPAILFTAVVVGLLAAWWERRLENAPEFPLGLLIGETAVLATIGLHSLVLAWGGFQLQAAQKAQISTEHSRVATLNDKEGSTAEQQPGAESGRKAWKLIALVALLAHLPLAAVEGVVLGFTVGFLVRVKPEMLRWLAPEKTPYSVGPLP
jgi:cobalt/nickel transport system permease protein